MVAFRVSRPHMDRAAARAEVLKHTSSARRYAGVDLDVAPLPDRERIGSGFVLVYNQTSIADDLGNLEVFWQVADRSVLAEEYGRIPFFQAAARTLGIVLMRRGNRASTEKTLSDLAGWAASARLSRWAPRGVSPSMGRWDTSSGVHFSSPFVLAYPLPPWPCTAADTSFDRDLFASSRAYSGTALDR